MLVDQLSESSTHVESGAGLAVGMIQKAEERLKQKIGLPRMIALGAVIPKGPEINPYWAKRLEDFMKSHPKRFRYVEGPFEQLDIEKEGLVEIADLITDVMGILSYTLDFSGSLEKLLRMLKVGGSLYIFGADAHTTVTQNGKKHLLYSWLQEGGVSGVKMMRDSENPNFDIVIIKTSANPKITPLYEIDSFDGTPPMREFAVSRLTD